MSETVAPTNDIIFRRLIMNYYHMATESAVDIQIYLNTPKKNRRGRIENRGYSFRVSFAKLYKFTRNIKGMGQCAEIGDEITKWLDIVPDFRTEDEMTNYYLKGILLEDEWGKILIDQGIIEFR